MQSIRNQTCCEIEIIVIDDGSTVSAEIRPPTAGRGRPDRSRFATEPGIVPGAECQRIARRSGEFVYFMDSDDLLEKDALETCYRKCTEQRLDFVIFDAEAFSDEGRIFRDPVRTNAGKCGIVSTMAGELLALLLREGRYLPSACLSFVRLRSAAGIRTPFLPDMLHEDELYTPMLYLYAARVGCIERAFFKRRVREVRL